MDTVISRVCTQNGKIRQCTLMLNKGRVIVVNENNKNIKSKNGAEVNKSEQYGNKSSN